MKTFNSPIKITLYSLCLFALFTVASCSTYTLKTALPAIDPEGSECVVLVHGLWRSSFAMRSIASDLEDNGYQTVSINYPSTKMEIPDFSKKHLTQGVQDCGINGAEKIHFVSHSMGGILVRHFLQNNKLPQGSKVVMLSPPNQGSELSERFGDTWWYKLFVGPAGTSLSKKSEGIINSLGEIDPPLGIIAAYRSWSLWPESWLPKPNDGTVSVASMKLKEMDDFVLVNSGHAMMRSNSEVLVQIRYFLAKGVFQHEQNVGSL